jgi:hypothetical protein
VKIVPGRTARVNKHRRITFNKCSVAQPGTGPKAVSTCMLLVVCGTKGTSTFCAHSSVCCRFHALQTHSAAISKAERRNVAMLIANDGLIASVNVIVRGHFTTINNIATSKMGCFDASSVTHHRIPRLRSVGIKR